MMGSGQHRAQGVFELRGVSGEGELLQVQTPLHPEPRTVGWCGMDVQLRNAPEREDSLGGGLLELGVDQQQPRGGDHGETAVTTPPARRQGLDGLRRIEPRFRCPQLLPPHEPFAQTEGPTSGLEISTHGKSPFIGIRRIIRPDGPMAAAAAGSPEVIRPVMMKM